MPASWTSARTVMSSGCGACGPAPEQERRAPAAYLEDIMANMHGPNLSTSRA